MKLIELFPQKFIFILLYYSMYFVILGYRHINILSANGDPIENCSLFVHVAITNKRGGGVSFLTLLQINFNCMHGFQGS